MIQAILKTQTHFTPRIMHRVMGLLCFIVTSVFTATGADTRTCIFDPSFRTLTVRIEGDRLAPPVLTLVGDDRLVIGFDELADERTFLRYRIMHCNADWQPSELVDSEVFDGFNYADVSDYEFSRGTATHYVHYTITLPNSDYQFRISGNYLLQVYREDDPDTIVFQARFMVSEGAVAIGGEAMSRTDIDFNDRHQQLSVVVDTRNFNVRDVFNDLRVVVNQNYRPDREVTVVHPRRVQGSRLYYDHIPELIFPAGNEYRRMETVTSQYPGMGVADIEYHAPYYHHWLNVDTPRDRHSYVYDSTQHGRFFVREYNSDNSDTEADYTLVHFTLDHWLIPDADVWLEGEFTGRADTSASRMEYDAADGLYHKTMLLKQGAYNYQYVVTPPAENIEGDKYQTVNEYFLRVYYRVPGERYDRLLGASAIFSGR